MSIHFLRCSHGNERKGIHDVIHDTFIVIVWDDGFHVGWKQLHAFPSTMFNSFCQQVDIIFIKDGICILVDIVIIDPMQTNLFLWSYATQRFATFDAIQTKEMSYHDRHPTDKFLPLAIENLDVYTNKLMCFYMIVPMPFGVWKCQKVLFFFSWLLFFIKTFQSHCKKCKHPPF